jgi:hypothetical protein
VLLAPSFRARRLRDDSRSDPEVLGYLKAENVYADAYFEQLQPLVDSLADSMDATVPAVEVSQVGLQDRYMNSSSSSRSSLQQHALLSGRGGAHLGLCCRPGNVHTPRTCAAAQLICYVTTALTKLSSANLHSSSRQLQQQP